MLDRIALRRLRCWIDNASQPDIFQAKVLGFELGQLGFKITNIDRFTSTTRSEFETALTTLQEMRGGDVEYVPLFTHFPDDLPNDGEYLIRRILGFFGVDTFVDSSNFGVDPVTHVRMYR